MKKLAIIAIVPLMFLALNGCAEDTQEEQQVDETTMDTQEEQAQPEQAEGDIETSDIPAPEINLNDELSEADSIKNNEEKTIEDCDVLNDESLKERCIFDVYLFKALEERDSSYCDKIANESDKKTCYARLEYAESLNNE